MANPFKIETVGTKRYITDDAVNGVVDAGDILLKDARGRDWKPATGAEAVAARAITDSDNNITGYAIIVKTTSRGGVITYAEFQVSLNGNVASRGTSLTTQALNTLEASYGFDINNDGVGGVLPPPARNGAALAGDTTLGVWNYSDGSIRIDQGTDSDVLRDGRGNLFALASNQKIVGITDPDPANDTGWTIIIESTSAGGVKSYAQFAVSSGGTVASTGSTLTGPQLVSLGLLEAVAPETRVDRTDDITDLAGEPGLLSNTGKTAYFVDSVVGDNAGVTDPILLTDSRGDFWTPGAGVPVAVRADGGGFRMVVEFTSAGGIKTYQEFAVTDKGVATASGGTLSAAQAGTQLEAVYVKDIDGDGAVDLTTATLPARINLADKTVTMTFAQAAGRTEIAGSDGTEKNATLVLTGTPANGQTIAAGAGVKIEYTVAPGFVFVEGAGARGVKVFSTIQDAISGAAAGDTIKVGAGTFTGNVTVDKAVTILGANADAVGHGARGAESVIQGKVTISANGATLDGFTLTKSAANTQLSSTSFLGWDMNSVLVTGDGMTLANNIIEVFGGQTGKSGFVQLSGATEFKGNVVKAGAGYDAGADARGTSAVWINAGTTDAVSVLNNHLLVSTNVTVAGDADAIFLNNAGAVVIDGNLLKGTDGGFVAFGNYGPLTFTNNTIEDFAKTGLRIFESSATTKPDVVISGNTIDDSGTKVAVLQGSVKVSDGVMEATALSSAVIKALALANPGIDGFAVLKDGNWSIVATATEAEELGGSVVVDMAKGNFVVFEGMSIQAAINAANADDTIEVAAGTFNEVITINKAGLTLLGANAGIEGHSLDRGAETILTGAGSNATFSVTAADVTIDGFNIAKTANTGTPPIDVTGANATFKNNIINSATYQKASGLTFEGNLVGDFLFAANFTADGYSRNAVTSDGNRTFEDSGFTDNVFVNVNRGLLFASVGGRYEDLVIKDNVFEGIAVRSIQFGNTHTIDGASVTGNTFKDGVAGIGVFSPVTLGESGLTAEDNSFENMLIGVWINAPSAAGLFIDQESNSFNNVDQAVRFQSPIPSLDIAKVLGGNMVDFAEVTIKFFAATESSSARYEVTLGETSVTVVGIGKLEFDDGNVLIVGPGGFATIQAAMDAATDGDTVIVAEGAYTETVTVSKDVTILMDDDAVLTGGFDVGAVAFTLEGGTIKGGAQLDSIAGKQAIFVRAGADVTVEDTVFDGTGSTGQDRAIEAGVGASTISVDGATLTNWAAAAIYVNPGDELTVNKSIFTGNLVGIGTDGPAKLIVTGSTFSNTLEAVGLTAGKVIGEFQLTGNTFELGDQIPLAYGGVNTGVTTAPNSANVLFVTAGQSIQAAINAVPAGGTVIVGAGTYNENITITKAGITLLAAEGREATKIVGSDASGLLGTIQISAGTNNVTINGFKVEGINGNGGLEKAAVYITGANDGLKILNSEIVAKGDAGLMSEFGGALKNALIDGNILSGKTFVGDTPQSSNTNTFSGQFDSGNDFPRQLVVLGNGGAAVPSTSDNVTFSNNVISGTAGGISSVTGQPFGNNLVTIDVSNATINGNTFIGVTGELTAALRARRDGTDITDNVFDLSDGGQFAYPISIFLQNNATGEIRNNSFVGSDGRVAVVGTLAPDNLIGTDQAEAFFSFTGNDTLTGGSGEDVFVFTGTDIGTSTITDFEGAGVSGGDVIDLRALRLGEADLAFTPEGGNTVITAANVQGSITLLGVTVTQPGDDVLL